MINFLRAAPIVIGIAIVLALALGLPLMILWNAVVPGIFPSVPQINFFQAVGLNILCWFLFKDFPSTK